MHRQGRNGRRKACLSDGKLGQTPNVRWMRAGAVGLLAAVWLLASSHVLLHRIGVIHEVHHDHHHHDPFASVLGALQADAAPTVDQHADPHTDDPTGETPVHEHDHRQHDAADGRCQLTASDSLLHPAPELRLLPGPDLQPTSPPATSVASRDPRGRPGAGSGPPGLTRRWQFLQRTALPVRAPSRLA